MNTIDNIRPPNQPNNPVMFAPTAIGGLSLLGEQMSNYGVNSQNGWVRVYRSIWNKGFSRKPNYLAVWMYLITNANHSDYEFVFKNETIQVQRGSLITSIKGISEYFRISLKSVQDILKYLEKENQIYKRSNNVFTYISITNYNEYQSIENQKYKPGINQVETKYKPSITNNNVKNDNKVNNKEEEKETFNSIIKNYPLLENNLREFIKMRQTVKKPLTTFAFKKIITALQKISTDVNEQNQILEQSIIKSWLGVFPLKSENRTPVITSAKEHQDWNVSIK